MKDSFSGYHPLTNFIYFFTVIFITVFSMHPAVLCVSCLGAFVYSAVLSGVLKTVKNTLCFALPVALLTAVINPLFNHYGVTVLFFLPSGNPVTLESTMFGLSAGLMMAAAVLWFICLSRVFTSDKYICLIGRVAPHVALLISMILRFIPMFDRRRKKIKNARQCIGRGKHDGIGNFSILTTWALENNSVVADSMLSRGYGTGRRTFFSVYAIKKRDVVAYLYMAVTAGFFVGGLWDGMFKAAYDPVINISFDMSAIPGLLCFLFFCLYPVLVAVYGKVRRYMSLRTSSDIE